MNQYAKAGMDAFPKVLIIGQPFEKRTGGGITQSNLFNGWPKEKLAVVCLSMAFQGKAELDICDKYYQLGQKEESWMFPFNLLKKNHFSGQLTFGESKPTQKKTTFRVKMILNYFLPLLKYFGIVHFAYKVKPSEDLYKWIDAYNPDVVYIQVTSRAMIAFCLEVEEYLNKPFVFHMMDDWPSLISYKGVLKNYWSRIIDKELRVLLERTSVFMSISDFMTAEYCKRYGKEFLPFHNPINLDFWKKHQKTNYEIGKSPTLLYAGRTGLGIDASLKTIAQAVDVLNREGQLDLKFVLQTPEEPEWSKGYTCVQYRSLSAYQELPRLFAEADLLILPYDFSRKSLRFIKYSMPTKASEYMACGTPIVIFAPEDTALVQYALSKDWAKAVVKNEVKLLAETLQQMIQNQAMRTSIAQKAIAIAESSHNAAYVASQFQQTICAATKKQQELMPEGIV